MKHDAVYYEHPDVARERGETEGYRDSLRMNRECCAAIDGALRRHFKDNHLSPDGAAEVVAQLGQERVFAVLANTMNVKDYDGRFSDDNKRWAKSVQVPAARNQRDYFTDAHPALLDGFIGQVRKLCAEREKPSILDRLAEHQRKEPMAADNRQQPSRDKSTAQQQSI